MNDHKKPVSGAEATANPIPSQGRRRLVKGAMLATPAVLTLRSGAAWALGSCSNVYVVGNKAYQILIGSKEVDGQTITYYYYKDELGHEVPIEEIATCWSNFSSINPGATNNF